MKTQPIYTEISHQYCTSEESCESKLVITEQGKKITPRFYVHGEVSAAVLLRKAILYQNDVKHRR